MHSRSRSACPNQLPALLTELANQARIASIGYDAALLASPHGWHGQTNDPWLWLTYFTEVLASGYQRFEQRAASDRSTGTKQDRVREYVLEHAPRIFRIARGSGPVRGVGQGPPSS